MRHGPGARREPALADPAASAAARGGNGSPAPPLENPTPWGGGAAHGAMRRAGTTMTSGRRMGEAPEGSRARARERAASAAPAPTEPDLPAADTAAAAATAAAPAAASTVAPAAAPAPTPAAAAAAAVATWRPGLRPACPPRRNWLHAARRSRSGARFVAIPCRGWAPLLPAIAARTSRADAARLYLAGLSPGHPLLTAAGQRLEARPREPD